LEEERAGLDRDRLIRLPEIRDAIPGSHGTVRLFANPSPTSAVFPLRSLLAPGPAVNQPTRTSFYTGRVNGDLGEGPQFRVVSPVERNVAYRVWIRAIGPTGGAGGPSRSWEFTWRTPRQPPDP